MLRATWPGWRGKGDPPCDPDGEGGSGIVWARDEPAGVSEGQAGKAGAARRSDGAACAAGGAGGIGGVGGEGGKGGTA